MATLQRHRPTSSWMWLSLGAAIATIGIKSAAASVSGSVGFFSDALESLVNLVAAIVTLLALRWSEAPPDEQHPFGHAKGELLAALLEGALVFLAGVAIIYASIHRFMHPAPIAHLPLALALSAVAALINGAVGATLVNVGRAQKSNALEADGHHLLSDVWTSAAVAVGVGLVYLTGRAWLDPTSATLVALWVLRTGFDILSKAARGLVDSRSDPEDRASVARALSHFKEGEVAFRTVRTRRAGREVFIHLTILVPGEWTVRQGHDFADKVERAIAEELPFATVETHIEPL